VNQTSNAVLHHWSAAQCEPGVLNQRKRPLHDPRISRPQPPSIMLLEPVATVAAMPASGTPVKTPQGQEELRRRVRGLGQRYRTLLLLVDGRRSLREVLTLGRRAGAAISHFEELMSLGLVELAAPSAKEPARPTVDDREPAAAQAQPATSGPAAAAPPEPQAQAGVAVSTALIQPEPEPESAPVPDGETDPAEELSLSRVRTVLIEMLLIDAPLSVFRFGQRVRAAQTSQDLADLVWEIEHHVTQIQRSHPGQQRLQTARELLGLGNTQVSEDTLPGYLD